MKVLYSKKQATTLLYEDELLLDDLVVLRRELRSYRTETGQEWKSPVINGEYEDVNGNASRWRGIKFQGEPRPTYLDAIPVPSLRYVNGVLNELVHEGFIELEGVRVLLSLRKTTVRAGTTCFADRRIVIYSHTLATLLHEANHVVVEERTGDVSHSAEFQTSLLKLWGLFE